MSSPSSSPATTSGQLSASTRPRTRPLPRAAASARAAAARAPRWLWILLGLAVALRVYEMVVYSTVVDDYYTGDVGRFIRYGYPGIFDDEWQPSGYALFLSAIRSVWNALPLTVAIQHLLGLGTGLLLYATARRTGLRPALALIPAAFVFFSGDHLFLEQLLLTEAPWMALLAAALYAVVRGTDPERWDWRWLAASGLFLGLSIIGRNVSLPLPVVFGLWAAFVAAGAWRQRLRAAAAVIVPAAAVIVVYTIVATSIGTYSGMGDMSGWSLYERVGQFADCSKFDPPDGTQGFCERRPPDQRPGPFYYYFDPTSPGRQVFPSGAPEFDGKAGAFARAAILHQPLDYARTVTKDVVRYFDPNVGSPRPLSGSSPDAMSLRQKPLSGPDRDGLIAKLKTKYTAVDPTPDSGTSVLETYDAIFRLNGLLLLALVAFTVVAIVRGRDRFRWVSVLIGASAVVLLVLPPMVSSYDSRYAIPPAALLAVSAALGLGTLTARDRADRT